MDYLRILQFVEMLVANSEGTSTRYLIQFHNWHEYHRCLLLLATPSTKYSSQEHIQFLPSIHAIRCNLMNSDCMNDFHDLVRYEVYQVLQLGARSQLPI